jgi:multidrug efflux system outer membrane protein
MIPFDHTQKVSAKWIRSILSMEMSTEIRYVAEQYANLWLHMTAKMKEIDTQLKNQANQEIQKAATEIALANYQQTILLSFAEVENQLSALGHLSTQLSWQMDASTQADKARDATTSRYQSGAGSYLESIEAQRNSLEIQRLVQQTKGQQLIASVTLVKALGGSWNDKMPTAPPSLPDTKKQVVAEKKPGFFGRLFGR